MNKVYSNRFGSLYKIVEFIDGTHVIIEFQDEHKIRKQTVVEAAISGSVRNPYDKSCNKVGFLGEGNYKTRIGKRDTVEYDCWSMMIRRCYNDDYKEIYPTYYNICTVSDEWFNFQNFAEWYKANEYSVKGRLHLDKDILVKGNKLYSSDKCLLVPQRINLIFMDYKRGTDPDLPTGINRSWHKDGTCNYRAMFNTTSVGTFITLEEAISEYENTKRKHIKKVADEYRNIVPKNVYEALMNW